MIAQLKGFLYGIIIVVTVIILSLISGAGIILLAPSAILSLVYLYIIKNKYSSINRENKDLEYAKSGDITEISGSAVSEDEQLVSVIDGEESVLHEWSVYKAERNGDNVNWNMLRYGYDSVPFNVESNSIEENIVEFGSESHEKDIDRYKQMLGDVDRDNVWSLLSRYSHLWIDISDNIGSEVYESTDKIPSSTKSFLDERNIDYRIPDDESSLVGPAQGDIRIKERTLPEGEEVFVRGVVEENPIMYPSEIGKDKREVCVVADSTRTGYINRIKTRIYTALTILFISVILLLSLVA